MQSRLLSRTDGTRTYAVVFQTGDEVIAGLTTFARRAALGGSRFTAIGALSDAVVGFFDWERKEYVKTAITEQAEVLSFAGDIALADGEPRVHGHIVLGTRNAVARGGHLMEGHVRPTLEVILVEAPAHLQRVPDPESGLALIRLPDGGPAAPDTGATQAGRAGGD